MTRTAKLYAHVAANLRASLPYREFEQLVKAFGFRFDRQRGSHRAFEHPACPRPLVLQPRKDGKAKPHEVVEFLDMIEAYRLSMDE